MLRDSYYTENIDLKVFEEIARLPSPLEKQQSILLGMSHNTGETTSELASSAKLRVQKFIDDNLKSCE